MSLLGTLEQFRLPNVLQRIESHEKTGLLVVRQGGLWVEFYVRNGCLLCIGPVRTSATLGDRLVQDKIISPQAWQELKSSLGNDLRSEMRLAIVLMERGHVTREQLRAWTNEKSLAVLRVVLAWTSGDIYFEEDTQPPSDRLLVSMSITSLVDVVNVHLSSPQTQSIQVAPRPSKTMNFNVTQQSPSLSTTNTFTAASITSPLNSVPTTPVISKADIARVPTLMEAAQFFNETASSSLNSLPTVSPETESFASFFNEDQDSEGSLPNTNEISFASLASIDGILPTTPTIQPELVRYPTPPKRIDTSFMQPVMVLVPADLSAFREQNPKVQITPDQWRILTCVDGCNSLQMTCQLLGLSPDLVCTLAGELVAEGLIHVVPPEQAALEQPANNTADPVVPGSYLTPAPVASSVGITSDSLPNLSTSLPFETESQWGNGGNGATFIPGRGWVTTPQPMQPLYSGPLPSPSNVYAAIRS